MDSRSIFVIYILSVALTSAAPLESNHAKSKPQEEWLGDGCSPEVWHANCGCDIGMEKSYKEKCMKIFPEASAAHNNSALGCLCTEDLMMDIPQLDALAVQLEKHNNARRKKRNIRIFSNAPVAQWDSPIGYKINAGFSEAQAKDIKASIDMWEQNTCLKFVEVPVNQNVEEQHIIFFKHVTEGCHSFIGRRIDVKPQPIYLGDSCFFSLGHIVHAIGHAIGLFHQHQRSDRDDYIRINKDAVLRSEGGNFIIINSYLAENLGVEYDYSSVMHYMSRIYSIDGSKTIETIDPRYSQIIGQRVELSFSDSQIVNKAYCQDSCQREEVSCDHGGYQDPLNCRICRCPDGWSGPSCDKVALPVKANCGGRVFAENSVQSIESPLYKSGFYENGVECTWLIEAPQGGHVHLRFESDFYVYARGEICMHWVEVRYSDLVKVGPRFCGSQVTNEVIASKGEQVLVNFRTKSHVEDLRSRRGFRLKFYTSK